MFVPPRPRARRAAFTLIELMVAMALMMILTGSVVFIFIQAQKIFSTVDARVQVYQYSRYAFDQMERDLANVIKSSDMEFFNDNPPPNGRIGRYDSGEEIPISGAEDNPSIYNHGFTLRQPELYNNVDGNRYRKDSVFFKTVTVAAGQTAAALVEYALIDTDKERPKLVKRLWRVTGVDSANPTRPKYQVGVTTQDLCLYTIDARFELFARNRRLDQVGQFWEAQQLVAPPRLPPTNREPFEATRNDWLAPDFMMQCYYDTRHDVSRPTPDQGVFEPGEGGLFHTEAYFTFPMLREGDHLYIYGGGLAIPKEYTIESFVKVDGSVPAGYSPFLPTDPLNALRIKFKEGAPEWPTGVPTSQPLRVDWDTAWIPPALRVTLRIKDAKSLQTRSVQRVFKILSN
jgi:prepilin-type N-terminal cleavage/methylation domain-containing protein